MKVLKFYPYDLKWLDWILWVTYRAGTYFICNYRRFWNRIWKTNVLPKVWNFVWRACTDILPTRANLYRRKVPIDPLCSICGQTDETVGHALWECPMARNVWAMAQRRLQKCGIVAQNFYRLVRQLEGKLTGKEMETWATVTWAIWNARNRFCFEEKQSQPKDILQGASTLLQDYQRWNRDLDRKSVV